MPDATGAPGAAPSSPADPPAYQGETPRLCPSPAHLSPIFTIWQQSDPSISTLKTTLETTTSLSITESSQSFMKKIVPALEN
jgi:hypothetical protein